MFQSYIRFFQVNIIFTYAYYISIMYYNSIVYNSPRVKRKCSINKNHNIFQRSLNTYDVHEREYQKSSIQ
jgi:hypothetical protein